MVNFVALGHRLAVVAARPLAFTVYVVPGSSRSSAVQRAAVAGDRAGERRRSPEADTSTLLERAVARR